MNQARKAAEEAFDLMFKRAAQMIAAGQQVPATILPVALVGDGMVGVPLPADLLPKDQWASLQASYLEKAADVVGIISEGWAVKVDPRKPEDMALAKHVRPSQHPDRTEVVTFVFTFKDGSRMSAVCDIERKDGMSVLKRSKLEVNTADGTAVTGGVLPASAVEEVLAAKENVSQQN